MEEAIINLDENESLTYEDKTSILKRHSQKHNTEDSEDYIDECCKYNTVIGFPLMSWFIAIYTKTVYFIPSKSLFIPHSLSFSIRSTKVDGNCAKYRTPIATLRVQMSVS
jgi:hypothetical protein